MAVSQTMIDEILDSAQMLAQQMGYAGFSFQDVARCAGRTLAEIEQRFNAAGLEVAELSLREPGLHSVYLHLTGRSAQ